MRTRALIVRIIRQFWHDKRTLALMFFAPMLILWLVSMVFNGNTYSPRIGLVDVPSAFSQKLADAGADVTTYATSSDAETALESQKLDAFIQLQAGEVHVKLEGSDPAKSKAVLLLLQKTIQSAAAGQMPAFKPPVVTYLYGSESMTSFDNFGPVLIGVFAFFFVFLIAGISFLKERTSGTLERLMATPLKRWEMVMGYVIGFGIFTTVQSCLIAWFAVDVLGLMMNGQFIWLLLVTLLLSMTALTLGTLLSSFANSEFQMMQFIPLVIVPQIFFSGLFSIDNMATWMRWLSYIMPLRYGADALRNVMIRGKGLADIWLDILVLLGFSLVFMVTNALALRKYRSV